MTDKADKLVSEHVRCEEAKRSGRQHAGHADRLSRKGGSRTEARSTRREVVMANVQHRTLNIQRRTKDWFLSLFPASAGLGCLRFEVRPLPRPLRLFAALLLLALLVPGGLNAGGSLSSGGDTGPFAQDSNVTISPDGAPVFDVAGSSCCDGEGTYVADGQPTWSWSDGTSGTSTTLDTSLSGEEIETRGLSATVTQNFVCSADSADTTSDSYTFSGSFDIWPTCGGVMYDPALKCCSDGSLEDVYNGANPCDPPVIPSSTYMAAGTQSIPAFNQTVVVTMIPRREKLFRMNAGSFSNRTFNVTPSVHGSSQSSSCGGGIPTQILNPGTFSVSVSASLGPLSVSMGWSGGGTSFPIYDKTDADPESDVWKFGTSYEIEEKPNAARITITGTEELLYSPYTISQVNYQNSLVYFPNASKETVNFDYRICSMCCN